MQNVATANDMQTFIGELIKEFDGNVKYTPMLQDHPDWTKEQCLAFARKWDAVARKQGNTNHIPYGRNIFKETK